MPTISAFYGIVIRMFYRDHAPPHVHAVYGDDEVLVEIRTLRVMAGRVPLRALGSILQRAALHQSEPLDDRDLCRRLHAPRPIAPLE